MNQLEETLIQLAQLLNSNHINWALGGSALLKLRGIELDVNDIDIMIHENDFQSSIDLLKTVSIECEVKESEVFKTKYYKKFIWNNIHIDCMCGMALHLSNNTFNYQYDHKDKDIELDNTHIPLCYIEDWYILYHLMPNREKKISIIEKYFENYPIDKQRFDKLLQIDIPNNKRLLIETFIKDKKRVI